MATPQLFTHFPTGAQLSYFQLLAENSMVFKMVFRSSCFRSMSQRTFLSFICFSKFAEPTAPWSWTHWAFDSFSKNSMSLFIKYPSALTYICYFYITLIQFWSMIFGSIQIMWTQGNPINLNWLIVMSQPSQHELKAQGQQWVWR